MRRWWTLSIISIMLGLMSIACSSSAGEPTASPAAAVSSPPQDSLGVGEDDVDKKDETQAAAGDTALMDEAPAFLRLGWDTDFSRHSVPYSEIVPGGPRRDGIPPIDNPRFIDVAASPDYMKDGEPVVSLEFNGGAKAYPLAVLISHEIVNDEIGGLPVSVTYCPLCNTAIVFDRRVEDRVFDFGTSGNLRNSDLIMWDRQTQSWWQQITGEAIVGELTGAKLTFIPAQIVSWEQFRKTFPDGRVLSRDTGFRRSYDSPPYAGYDDLENTPFLFFDEIDPRLAPMERVVTVSVGDRSMAYPFSALAEHPVVNDSVNGRNIVVIYAGGALSPFKESSFGQNRSVGAAAVYEPFVDGERLTFGVENGVVVDRETGSAWSILGKAIDGPLAGKELAAFLHGNHFWFAWVAFNPDTAVYAARGTAE